MTAERILRTAADVMAERGKKRDTGKERSMARTVRAFNAVTGLSLTETQGWVFMAVLKLAREASGHDPDNFVDGAAYMALAGESADAPSNTRSPDGPVRAVVPAPAADQCGLYRDQLRPCSNCEDD
jgi:hypothetical protein